MGSEFKLDALLLDLHINSASGRVLGVRWFMPLLEEQSQQQPLLHYVTLLLSLSSDPLEFPFTPLLACECFS